MPPLRRRPRSLSCFSSAWKAACACSFFGVLHLLRQKLPPPRRTFKLRNVPAAEHTQAALSGADGDDHAVRVEAGGDVGGCASAAGAAGEEALDHARAEPGDAFTAAATTLRLDPVDDLPALEVDDRRQVAVAARRQHRRVLMHAQVPELLMPPPIRRQLPRRVHRGDRLQRLFGADVPDHDFAQALGRDELTRAATLHVHARDPAVVLVPDADHGVAPVEAPVVDAEGAVAEAGDEDVAGDLVGGQAGDAGGAAGGDLRQARLCLCVPDFDRFDVASYKELALGLLPFEDEAGVVGGGLHAGQGAPGGDELDLGAVVVVPVDLHHAVFAADDQQADVVFVDHLHRRDPRAERVLVREAAEPFLVLPVPDRNHVPVVRTD